MREILSKRPKIERILIVRLSAVGDVVKTLPALTSLRRGYPKAHIAWLVEDRAADLLRNHPFLDEVFVFPRSELGRAVTARRGRLRTIAGCFRFLAGVRSRRFDMAIDFQGNFKSGLVMRMTGARLRVGYDRRNTTEGNYVFTNRRVPIADARVNRAEKYLALARALGGAAEAKPVLPAWPEDAAMAEALLRDPRVSRRPLVVIHPGTSEFGAFKRWAPEQYGRLAQHLTRERGASVVVTWGPREHSLAEKVAAASGDAAVLAPATHNLRELAELLRRADLFVGADTGPMHIAAALDVPVVALFGPKDPVLHGPYGSNTRVVRAGVECSPCAKRSCDDLKCMTRITPAMVLKAVEDLLGPPARRTAKCRSSSSSSSRPRPAEKGKGSHEPSSEKGSRPV
jgi:lipopolysaccharide heptosyltransferase I